MIPGEAIADIVCDVAEQVARLRRAGRVRLVRRGTEGPTTDADLFAENNLVERLGDTFRHAAFLAEESNDRANTLVAATEPWVWIIDPLDGTSQYLNGSDLYGVQVALYGQRALRGAWVVCPDLGWRAWAWHGGDLYLDGVTKSPVDGSLVIASGDFDPDHRAFLQDSVGSYVGSRSCAVEYLLLCAGMLDSTLYRRTYPWDHAAGAYLLSRAGGSSQRWDGSRYDPAVEGTGIVSAARGIDITAVRGRQLPTATT